jgi:hypothetical protein
MRSGTGNGGAGYMAVCCAVLTAFCAVLGSELGLSALCGTRGTWLLVCGGFRIEEDGCGLFGLVWFGFYYWCEEG